MNARYVVYFLTDAYVNCASQRHFHSNVCVTEESSTGLVRLQACELSGKGETKATCVENVVQVLKSSVKLARFRLPHATAACLFRTIACSTTQQVQNTMHSH